MADADDYGDLLLDKKDAEREVRDSNDRIREFVAKVVNQKLGTKYEPDALLVGSWDCLASPVESCIYDDKNDRNHDFCLFCQEPEERG